MIPILELQRLLFEKEPTRRELLDYKPISEHHFRIGVYRNHSFELVEHTIGAYLDYAGFTVEFVYSDYDDSLTFFEIDCSVDAMILWLDTSRYHGELSALFVNERIRYLEKIYEGSILVIPTESSFIPSCNGRVIHCDLAEIEERLGQEFFDKRLEPYSGTKISAKACMEISRELGLLWLPAILGSTIKAVVVDLDNTLYSGVLGEDGVHDVILTEGHRQLQIQLKKMVENGFFLCIATKNDERDVLTLFQERTDFPLLYHDFTKICAGWDTKADSISKIAMFLNIYTDSILFIDDNIGELAAVSEIHPFVKLLHAHINGEITFKILKKYPGIFKLYDQHEDSLRKRDVQSNEQRKELKRVMPVEEYLRSLEMKLEICFDDPKNVLRVFELANKTNQFIFSYRRYGLAQVEKLIQDCNKALITASLSDRLADSGLIGVCVAVDKDDYLEIEECFVSCRALGRGIDEIIVFSLIDAALKHFSQNKLKICFVLGERNEPARLFVEKHLSQFLEEPASFKYVSPNDLVNVEIKKEIKNNNGRTDC